MTAFLGTLLHYSFMRHAFEAGTAVAVAAGVVGYFVVIRRSAFAAHALSHAGFAGAAGAVVLGIDPIYGLLAFTVGGATLMGALGRRMAQRDVEIGTVLAFMLGLGVLFISLYGGYASEAYSLLFGQVLGISATDVLTTVAAAAGTLVVVAALYRPLLFCSLDEDVAAARGVRTTALGMVFLVLLAVATSVAVQVVGVLLIFALMVTPAAVAQRLVRRPGLAIAASVGLAVAFTWLGLAVAWYTPYPVSFFITAIAFATYLSVRLGQHLATARGARVSGSLP